MFEILDNALPDDAFQTIHNTLLSLKFPWFYNDQIFYDRANTNGRMDERLECAANDNYQLNHVFFYRQPNSPFNTILQPLYEVLGARCIYRAKANMNPRTSTRVYHGKHYDVDWEDAKVAILYVNTNDGVTVFENGSEVGSKANRLVKFSSSCFHGGSTCTDAKVRVVINVVYF